ncbi:MAG TPA: nucleoside 2-deoxyribosyltransferase [Candidatus Paceibacterota bacterium]|nr:nucleoside 2-deoxyribosyltransferase [Candidatus Paceibacterota bacterium]
MKDIYLAGGLFNAGERLHNLYLEKHLKLRGHPVILPQREALKHWRGDHFDIKGIVKECINSCKDRKKVVVGNSDGADADSGTCVEYGITIAVNGQAVIYRTDFRTDLKRELGMNAMLTAKGTIIIYEPCFFTELEEVDEYYSKLAQLISDAVETL